MCAVLVTYGPRAWTMADLYGCFNTITLQKGGVLLIYPLSQCLNLGVVPSPQGQASRLHIYRDYGRRRQAHDLVWHISKTPDFRLFAHSTHTVSCSSVQVLGLFDRT
jgi:hypothetical protein